MEFGDNITADVEDSSAVGILPVWYENQLIEDPRRIQDENDYPSCEHFHIYDWMELIDILEGDNDVRDY